SNTARLAGSCSGGNEPKPQGRLITSRRESREADGPARGMMTVSCVPPMVTNRRAVRPGKHAPSCRDELYAAGVGAEPRPSGSGWALPPPGGRGSVIEKLASEKAHPLARVGLGKRALGSARDYILEFSLTRRA